MPARTCSPHAAFPCTRAETPSRFISSARLEATCPTCRTRSAKNPRLTPWLSRLWSHIRCAPMLVVRIELWPGGAPDRAREIGRLGIANVSDMAEVSDYVAVLQDDSGHESSVFLSGHRRNEG